MILPGTPGFHLSNHDADRVASSTGGGLPRTGAGRPLLMRVQSSDNDLRLNQVELYRGPHIKPRLECGHLSKVSARHAACQRFSLRRSKPALSCQVAQAATLVNRSYSVRRAVRNNSIPCAMSVHDKKTSFPSHLERGAFSTLLVRIHFWIARSNRRTMLFFDDLRRRGDYSRLE